MQLEQEKSFAPREEGTAGDAQQEGGSWFLDNSFAQALLGLGSSAAPETPPCNSVPGASWQGSLTAPAAPSVELPDAPKKEPETPAPFDTETDPLDTLRGWADWIFGGGTAAPEAGAEANGGPKSEGQGTPKAKEAPEDPLDKVWGGPEYSLEHDGEKTKLGAESTRATWSGEQTTKGGVELTSDSLGGELEQSNTYEDDTGKHESSFGGGLSYGEDGFSGSATTGSSHTYTDADGVEHTDQSSTGVSVSRDAIDFSTSSASGTKDGAAEGTAFSGGVTADGAVRGGMSSSWRGPGEDAKATGVSATGSIDLVGDNKGVAGSIGASHGSAKINLSGGWSVEVQAPVPAEDGYVVAYQCTFQAGATAGVGVSFGGKYSDALKGTKWFATLEAAEAWRHAPSIPPLPTTPDEAAKLRPGDMICAELKTGLSVGAEQDMAGGVAKASIGAQNDTSHAVTIKGGEGNLVTVTLEVGETQAVKGAVSSGGLGSVGATDTEALKSTETWSFDLSQPGAVAAYGPLVENEVRPDPLPAGVTRIGFSSSYESSSGQSIDALGVSAGHQSGFGESVSIDGNGERTDKASGWDKNSASIPFLGSSSETSKLQVSDDAGGRDLVGSHTIADTDGGRAHVELAGALGQKTDQHTLLPSGDSSGTWRVDTEFTSDAAVDNFVTRAREEEDVNTVFDDRDQLREDLIRAGDDEGAQRVALAQYLQNGGEAAMEDLKGQVAHEDYVCLEGDPYLTGLAGHRETEARITALEADKARAQTETEWRAVYEGAHELRAHQEDKLRALTNRSNYAELPFETRATEMGRTQAVMVTVAKLEGEARAGWEAAAGGGIPAEATEGGTLDTGIVECAAARAACERAYDELRKRQYAHNMAAPSQESIRDGLATDLFGWLEGDEYGAYADVDAVTAEAMALFGAAQEAESMAQHAPPTGDEGMEAASSGYSDAASKYRQAQVKMLHSCGLYDAIGQRHGTTRDYDNAKLSAGM